MSVVSVVLGVISTQFFGMVWYNVFSGPWLRGLGKKRGDFKGDDSAPYIQAALSMLALSLLMSATLGPFFGVVTVEEAIHFALRVSLAGAILQLPHKAFEGTGWSTYLVNVGYDALCLLIVCVITTIS